MGPGEELAHLGCGRLVVGTDHDALGMQAVGHGRPLAQELRIGHDRDVVAAEHPLDHQGRAHRHRRLVDDDRSRHEVPDRSPWPRTRRRRGRPTRRPPAGSARTGRRTRRPPPPPWRPPRTGAARRPGPPPAAPRGGPRRWDPPLLEQRHLGRVGIGTGHPVAQVGERGGGGQTDVPHADDRDGVPPAVGQDPHGAAAVAEGSAHRARPAPPTGCARAAPEQPGVLHHHSSYPLNGGPVRGRRRHVGVGSFSSVLKLRAVRAVRRAARRSPPPRPAGSRRLQRRLSRRSGRRAEGRGPGVRARPASPAGGAVPTAGGRRCPASSWPVGARERGGSRSAVAMGSTSPGSSPAAARVARAKPYQVVSPWLVTWKVPGRRSRASRTTAPARSAVKVGQPCWSSTNRSGPSGLAAASRSTVLTMLAPWAPLTHAVRTMVVPGPATARTSSSPPSLLRP